MEFYIGQVAMGMGQDPSNNLYAIGQSGGSPSVQLLPQNVGNRSPFYVNQVSQQTTCAVPVSSAFVGEQMPVATMPPYLVMNYCICTMGIYPVHP